MLAFFVVGLCGLRGCGLGFRGGSVLGWWTFSVFGFHCLGLWCFRVERCQFKSQGFTVVSSGSWLGFRFWGSCGIKPVLIRDRISWFGVG